MSSERAGAPTHGVLNRDAARDVLSWYRSESADSAYDDEAVARLEACVVPDPRITRIEALHKPEEGGMGYHDDGHYGSFEGPVCSTCGTADEYGVPWPCPTIRALQNA